MIQRLIILLAVLLSGCAGNLAMQSNTNGISYQQEPTNVQDPRTWSPAFYMDKADALPTVSDMPRNNR